MSSEEADGEEMGGQGLGNDESTSSGTGLAVIDQPADRNSVRIQLAQDHSVEIPSNDMESMTDEQFAAVLRWADAGPYSDEYNNDKDFQVAFDAWFFESMPDCLQFNQKVGDVYKVALKPTELAGVVESDPTIDIEIEYPKAKVETAESRQLREIFELNQHILELQEELETAESELKLAKAHKNECEESWLLAQKEMSVLIRDGKVGQQRFDFAADSGGPAPAAKPAQAATAADATAKPAATPEKEPDWPLSDLGAKQIKNMVGAEEFERAKSQEDPIGLSDKQLDKLEEQDISTVQELEKKLREKRDFLKEISGFGESAINRVISTLAAFRRVHPMPNDGK